MRPKRTAITRLPCSTNARLIALVIWAATACASTPADISPTEIQRAMVFRTTIGLRADEAWIRQVAADPTSRAGEIAYSVPLTPAEKAALDARALNYQAVLPAIQEYGEEHPESWAGVFVEPKANGVVVARFSRDVDKHRAALARLLNPLSRYRVEQVQWTAAELETVRNRIKRDLDWLTTIGAEFRGLGVDASANSVSLRIWTDNPDASKLIADHFDAHGRLSIEFDPVAPWRGGFGKLFIRAVNRAGRPVAELTCIPIADVPGAYNSDTGFGTGADGWCRIPRVGASSYTVELRKDGAVVGRGRVTVPANGVGAVTITVR